MPLPASLRGATERAEHGVSIINVREPNTLTQVVGWLRFRSRSSMVLMRGQNSIHPDTLASGFRGLHGPGREHLAEQIRLYIDELCGSACGCGGGPFSFGQAHNCAEQLAKGASGKRALVSSTYRSAVEPLLQHYGIKTRWLDLVDNVWIALWFACHRQEMTGRHAFHICRSPAQEGSDASIYVAVMESGPLRTTSIPGYLVGPESRVVDLRYSVPSVNLRPHAQHALLMAPRRVSDADGSLASQVTAYLEIRLVDALEWLGIGAMTSSHVLFPPAAIDEGFRRLLEHAAEPPEMLGSVSIFGPGA